MLVLTGPLDSVIFSKQLENFINKRRKEASKMSKMIEERRRGEEREEKREKGEERGNGDYCVI
jgi:hypothetical protein